MVYTLTPTHRDMNIHIIFVYIHVKHVIVLTDGTAPELSRHKECALACTCRSVSAVTCPICAAGSRQHSMQEDCKRPKNSRLQNVMTHNQSWVACDYLIVIKTNFNCFSINSCLYNEINHNSMTLQ